jgi:nucleotide-binding universal stress UspA family protein
MFHKILVAFDGSPGAWHALRQGILLAREHGAAVYVLSIAEPVPHYVSAAEEARSEETEVTAYFDRIQAEARREAARQGMTVNTEMVRGHAAEAIAAYARQIGADLIVIGRHRHAGLIERMLGSTSDRVVDTAHCSVLVVPGVHDRD